MPSIQPDAGFGVSSEPYTAFFYGTLLHPKVLKRVIGNEGMSDLRENLHSRSLNP
jgi:hypothetical protein